MSKKHNEMIKCPKCKHEGDFEVWESINTADAPEMKELVRNGKAFMWKCPECGNDSVIFYPTYYHQPEDRFLIHYIPENPTAAISFMNDLTHDPYDEKLRLEQGCRKRVVTEMNQFREKLLIFDEELDDHIIELMKIFLIADIQKNDNLHTVADIYFNKEKDDSLNFAVRFDNDKWASVEFSKENYEQVKKAFKVAVATDKDVVIDTEWAFSVINKAIDK